MIRQRDIYEWSFPSSPIPQFLSVVRIDEVIFETLGYEVELVDAGGFDNKDETLGQGGLVPGSMNTDGLEKGGQGQSASSNREAPKKLTSFVNHKEGCLSSV